jgi:SPP1 gp7 family putative phage head morphogenesis protein
MSTPEALYRNAIDLNRYSNSVARRVINAYNDIIIDAVNQLRTIDELAAPVKAARLRAILAQLKDSLATWAGDATELTAIELQGIAELQSEFVAEQLRRALPAGARNAVRTVEISPQFAQSVVTTDPTQINVVALSDDLFKSVYGTEALARQAGTGVFNLTAAQGATITLPNGEVIQKAFRGIAVDEAERFSQVVRQGLLTGETTPDIAKRLIGTLERSDDRLRFGQAATTEANLEALLQAGYSPEDAARLAPIKARRQQRAAGIKDIIRQGGQATAVADNQVLTLVRTSINQVANTASQQVYEANQDITKKYRYIATLDARTSSICRALDGREFEYGKGPMPPQHFNCRSTTVPVIDYEALGFDPPPEGTRASAGGQVPADMSYGQWLAKQDLQTKAKALGAGKVPYFDMISRKYGPKDAIAKLVRDDGSELTLEQLRARYGAT